MDQFYHPNSTSPEQKQITMIETPRYEESNDYLLTIFYTNVSILGRQEKFVLNC